jgi:hypothetical protein
LKILDSTILQRKNFIDTMKTTHSVFFFFTSIFFSNRQNPSFFSLNKIHFIVNSSLHKQLRTITKIICTKCAGFDCAVLLFPVHITAPLLLPVVYVAQAGVGIPLAGGGNMTGRG